ncbi:MAG TPA: hypothetical protein VMO47_11960 [Rhodothermales bacterium]|nr:hypothetical protein [Rhodothermales bacterium]
MGFISDLAVSGTTIFASGEMVVEWDGSSWNPLSGEFGGYVNGLETGDEGLYALGWFASIGDTAAYGVAKWDPTERHWLPVFPVMGQGIDGYVTALARGVDGSIFAGGSFNAAGDVVAKNIARWDSARWTSVGHGVPDDVQSIAAGATRLYAGTHLGVALTDLENPAWSYLPGLPDGSRLLNVRRSNPFSIRTTQILSTSLRLSDSCWSGPRRTQDSRSTTSSEGS